MHDRGAFDPAYTLRCYEENMRFIACEYFRARLVGAEHFPIEQIGRRAIIVVSNHSGMGLSWDQIILDFLIYDLLRERLGDAATAIENKVVRLIDPLLISHTTVAPFSIDRWFSRIGCRPASYANFEKAVRERAIISIAPEGVAGIAKGFHRKYRLQRYATSFLRLAQQYGAVIVPISVVNAEYVRPFNYCNPTINRIGRVFGLPFVPLGFGMLQFLFPATYLTPFPAKLTYVVHPPQTIDVLEKPIAETALLQQVERFRDIGQRRLDAAVKMHHRPFDFGEILKRFRTSRNRKMFIPFFWHEMFLATAGAPSLIVHLHKIPLAFPLIWGAKRLVWKEWSRVGRSSTP
jgi:1-acyl-sn-glycerol-3-phosphate acyltransferase